MTGTYQGGIASTTQAVEVASVDLRKQPLPAEFERWHWGAFLLNWIWGIGNNTYGPVIVFGWIFILQIVTQIIVFATLVSASPSAWMLNPQGKLDPFTGTFLFIGSILFVIAPLAIVFWIGRNGYRWAWENARWDSVDHFRRTQRAWTRWAVILLAGMALIVVLMFSFMFAVVKLRLPVSNAGVPGTPVVATSATDLSGAYEVGVREVRTSAMVATELGSPITAGPATGQVSSAARGPAIFGFPVAGPKGNGWAHIEARKDGGVWSAVRILVKVEGRDGSIDVLWKSRIAFEPPTVAATDRN